MQTHSSLIMNKGLFIVWVFMCVIKVDLCHNGGKKKLENHKSESKSGSSQDGVEVKKISGSAANKTNK